MTRGSGWLSLALALGLAGAGAAGAYILATGSWAPAGAVIGGIAGFLAPVIYDNLRDRKARDDAWYRIVAKPPSRSWARLLDPRLKTVRFEGRDDELRELASWCEDDHAGRLRLVTGPGGVGKTRLAVELADRMQEAGWTADRVADGQEADAIGALRAVTRRRGLLVIDYAEGRTGLKQMLSTLASEEGREVRVLLLARAVGEWWDQLSVGEPAIRDLVQAAASAQLTLSPVVADHLSDADMVKLAMHSFSQATGLPEKEVKIVGGIGRRRVLDLHAAALVALLGEPRAKTVRVEIGEVLNELLVHEQQFWYANARTCGLSVGHNGATAPLLRQIVAASCLLGAHSQTDASELVGRVPGMLPSAKIAGWLRVLYPPDYEETNWIGSLQPDRLAELHTLNELAAAPDLAQACLILQP